jgi:hypothetical protein
LDKTFSANSLCAAARRAVPFPVAAICIGYAIVLFARRALNDGDSYWHIAAGFWMLAHHSIPHADPFSYTFAGAPWNAHEWLSELIMALAYQTGAWDGILVLFAAAAATTCGALAVYLARWMDQPAAAVLFVLGIACTGSSLLARPHLLALTVLALWTIGILNAKDKGAAPSLMLLPLITAWANLHGSFVFGLALVAPIALEAVVETEPPQRLATARRWALFLAAAIGASLATPNGWHGLLFPFHLINMAINANIAEWAPTSFRTFQPLEGALVALLYVAFTRNVRLPIGRLAILIGLLCLSLAHARHQMIAGIVGAIILAKPLGQALANTDRRVVEGKAIQVDKRWIGMGVVCIALLTTIRFTHPLERSDDPVSPITALDHVPRELLNEPVLNSYDFGGYLIFRHVRPFIDGRADLYGDGFISAYIAALATNRSALEQTIDKYGIRWALLAAGSPAVATLSSLPHWRRRYADNVAAVFERDASMEQAGRDAAAKTQPVSSPCKPAPPNPETK